MSRSLTYRIISTYVHTYIHTHIHTWYTAFYPLLRERIFGWCGDFIDIIRCVYVYVYASLSLPPPPHRSLSPSPTLCPSLLSAPCVHQYG
jgi:hypothetical protein